MQIEGGQLMLSAGTICGAMCFRALSVIGVDVPETRVWAVHSSARVLSPPIGPVSLCSQSIAGMLERQATGDGETGRFAA